MQSIDHTPLLLFDGICNLCNSSVQFILKRDRKEQISFASLQSDASKNKLLQYKLKNTDMSSIVFIEENRVYQKSTAIFRICTYLTWPWRFFSLARYLPVSFTDYLYDIIAKNRYKWFGKQDYCTTSMSKHKNRFI